MKKYIPNKQGKFDVKYMHLYFARSRQSENKQQKDKDKHIAREITQ